ncbi:MAG: hypothetical protein V1827_00040 [Candidatus Micrarchaeota archaeon]
MDMEKAPRPGIAAALVLEPFGIYTPTKELITFINKSIIEHRKTHGKEDPFGFRNESELDYLVYKLNNHRYKAACLDNAIHVSSEILFYIACRHPFLEGNKTTAFSTAITLLEINLKLYVNPKLKTKYKLWKPNGEKESETQGKTMEVIASWAEGSDPKPLKERLIEKGILGRTAREPVEQDVKRFIKLFLREYIVE